MKILLAAFILLAGCSSAPFQKTDQQSPGYKIENSDRPEIFDVVAKLPGSASPEFRLSYLSRAAGEECLARGMKFFDPGPLGENSARVVCYHRPSKRSIGVVLDLKNPKAVVVEDTITNSYSPFKPRDVVKKIGGVDVDSIGALKEQIFRLADSGRKDVTVAVERSGIALSLEAPFSEQREAVLTPEALEALRKKAP